MPRIASACSARHGGWVDARSPVAEATPVRVRVPPGQFNALYSQANADHDAARDDEYLAGVVVTCRWLAGRPVWSPITRRAELPRSPVLYREVPATPETIDVEYAASLAPQAPRDVAYAQGVAATLAWVWAGTGSRPLDLPG